MEVRILGAHNLESVNTRLSSIVIDGVLVLDAGSLTASLSFAEQERIEAILLTHYHFDHIRDIATFGLANSYIKTTPVYSLTAVLEALNNCLINGKIYPRFDEWPAESPALTLEKVEPHETMSIGDYSVLAVPVAHNVPAIGYQVTDKEGKRLFYSGDTGAGLSICWPHISPHLIITEVGAPDSMKERMLEVGHLCPQLLKQELEKFHQLKGYLPPVVATHLLPKWEAEIRDEVDRVARELGASITVAREGMKLDL
jgi:cAMP phosphodiesterase